MNAKENIFECIQRQDLEALKREVKANPKIMAEANGQGIPALHVVVETGNVELVKFVIEYSIVNPCLLDGEGNTILHYGVKSGNLELVKYLVERVGMAVDRANLLGVTAYDLVLLLESGFREHDEPHLSKSVPGGACTAEGMQKIRVFFEEILGCTMDELYHNPIRTGMHPDPSIVRVGEDYYMVNSSFVYFPCIPISHSKDLIHWEVIGHAITNPEWARLKDLEGGRGYWAPDISYYEGKFYITATYRMNDGGEKLRFQMVTSSQRPEGPYCEPVFLDEDGIDPSIFTDVDGRRYMLLNRGARIFEISRDGREILSEPQLLWYGHNQKASEGPHLLYKDGYYYLFMAEGGTGMGHRISVARSKTLMGVYEPCPYNPILRQWDEERQLQCCGHGKPVQTPEGDWYMVYLCYRLGTSGYGFLGRETGMDPITWTADGWPVVNSLKGPSDLQRKPRVGKDVCVAGKVRTPDGLAKSANRDRANNHETDVWGDWSTVRGADSDDFEISADKMVVHGDGRDLNTTGFGNLLVKPQPDFSFEVSCKVKFECFNILPASESSAGMAVCDSETWDAGLTCYYDENSYLKLALANREGKTGILAAEYVDDRYVTEKFVAFESDGENCAETLQQGKIVKNPAAVELRIVTEGLKRDCYYRPVQTADTNSSVLVQSGMNNGDWNHVTTFESTAYLSSEGLSKGKRFTGAMAGIYVHGEISGIFIDFKIKNTP